MLLSEVKKCKTERIKELTARVQNRIMNDDAFLERVIKRLYSKQTDYEKQYKLTYDSNDVGFNSYDADYLSDLAEQLINNPEQHLSDRDKKYARMCVPHYARQIVLSSIKYAKKTHHK